jgi:CBS domain-containing protein
MGETDLSIARMTAVDLATKKLITARPSASITEVVDSMKRHTIKRIVVERDGRGLGMVSEKDVVSFAALDDTERPLDEIEVAEIMNKPLITVDVDAPVQAVAKLMLEKGISSLVVSDERRLRGIITKTDLCRYGAQKLAGRYKVKEFMSKNPLTVKPSHSIFYAAKLMRERKVSRLPVVLDGLKGIVTYSDLVVAGPAFKSRRLEGEEKFYRHKGFITVSRIIVSLNVRDVMTRDPLTITQGEDLAEAARRMQFYGISGLPVLDEKMMLAGMVTKTDVVRAVANLPARPTGREVS